MKKKRKTFGIGRKSSKQGKFNKKYFIIQKKFKKIIKVILQKKIVNSGVGIQNQISGLCVIQYIFSKTQTDFDVFFNYK